MKFRRTLLIYLAIVISVVGLIWFQVESFRRQRSSLENLQQEKVTRELAKRELSEALEAFQRGRGEIAKDFFLLDHGRITRPSLTTALPSPLPSDFREADQLEIRGESARALENYQRLAERGPNRPLALSRVARVQSKLGRTVEARETWSRLAQLYPLEEDLSHRPFGIVAAMAAGETRGLADRISSGLWNLPADQAEYYLSELGASASNPYLERFQVARTLQENARLSEDPTVVPGDFTVNGQRFLFRPAGLSRFEILAVNPAWTAQTRASVESDLDLSGGARREAVFYGGAIALVLLLLTAGIALLVRDARRETRISHLRSDFVSGVSHELKTPITLIRLYGETLLERPSLTVEEQRHFYQIIVRESVRLSSLVTRVLTFSRVERGLESYKLDVGDIGPPLAELIFDYANYVEQSGFHLHSDINTGLPPIRFDRLAVAQAATNLLENAVKYSGDGGEITARLRAAADSIVFEVQDAGCGIPQEEHERIFERFYRAANGAGKGGYGLGLFLVRHIMNAHGGRVEVQSAPGAGSTFRLVFPVL